MPPMNILDRLRSAWQKHDDKLAEEALREQPKVDPLAPLASHSDEDVHQHAQPED
jgi:hypothetical protein